MKKEKAVITISRYWDNPRILTKINLLDISLHIELDNFRKALEYEAEQEIRKIIDEKIEEINCEIKLLQDLLKKEIGSPLFYITKKSIYNIIDNVFKKSKLDITVDNDKIKMIFNKKFYEIINKIKEESVKVV